MGTVTSDCPLLLPRPLGLGGEEARLALGHHPAALPYLDALEDAGVEIGIAGQIGIERGAVGDVEDEDAAHHPALLEQWPGVDDLGLMALDIAQMIGAVAGAGLAAGLVAAEHDEVHQLAR